jgi:hypothetical protein
MSAHYPAHSADARLERRNADDHRAEQRRRERDHAPIEVGPCNAVGQRARLDLHGEVSAAVEMDGSSSVVEIRGLLSGSLVTLHRGEGSPRPSQAIEDAETTLRMTRREAMRLRALLGEAIEQAFAAESEHNARAREERGY